MMRQIALAAALIGLGLLPTSGKAAVSFALGNNAPQQNIDYTFLNNFQALGYESGSGDPAFTVTTDTALTVPGNGSSGLQVANPANLWQHINIDPLTDTLILALEADPRSQPGGTAGYFYVTASDASGTYSSLPGGAYSLTSGENYFTATASPGFVITDLNIYSINAAGVATPLIYSLRQVRTLEGTGVTATPEPATLVTAAMGLVLVGAGGLRRRLRSRKAAA